MAHCCSSPGSWRSPLGGWSRHGLGTKPWLETGPAAELAASGTPSLPTAKIGLGIFLAVVGSLLRLIISAYAMRMDMADWRPLPQPRLLWAEYRCAGPQQRRAAMGQRRGQPRRPRRRADGSAGRRAHRVLFVIGQLLAWRQLAAAGYRLATNPAEAFFYLITAVHGLHVLGGLVALGRAGAGCGAVPPWPGCA